jgi:hypothetical protein
LICRARSGAEPQGRFEAIPNILDKSPRVSIRWLALSGCSVKRDDQPMREMRPQPVDPGCTRLIGAREDEIEIGSHQFVALRHEGEVGYADALPGLCRLR